MKTPSKDIFKLIKSLDSQEKSYYKKVSKKYVGSKNYILVFNFIDKMQAYNEEKLKIALKKNGIVGDFKSLKRRTFESILKHLCDYHASSSFKWTVQQLIYKAQVLIEKKLFNVAEKELDKAEKLAKKAKDAQLLVEISNLRIKYYVSEKLMNKAKDYYDSGEFKKNIIHAESIVEEIYLHEKSMQIMIPYFKGNINKENVKEIQNIMKLAFDKELKHYQTHYSISLYYYNNFIYHSNILYNETSHHLSLAEQQQIEWIRYLEKESNLLKYRLVEYISANNNLMIIYAKLGVEKKVNDTFDKINKLYSSTSYKLKTNKVKQLFNQFYFNYISSLISFNSFEKAHFYWDKRKIILKDELREDPYFIALNANLFLIYFSLNDFHKSIKHLNEVLNLKSNHRIEIQSLARIFSLLNYYELKKYDLIPYLIKQIKTYFSKHKIKSAFLKEILLFFSQQSMIDWTPETEKKAFEELLLKINPIIKSPKETKFLKEFDFISWIESKIQNRPFVEVVREKAKQQ